MRLTRSIVLAGALLTGACATTSPSGDSPEFGWIRPVNSPEAMFHRARALAEHVVRLPECYAALSSLPDWPPGPVLTEFVTAWPDGRRDLLARTVWRNSDGKRVHIPPRIDMHAYVLESRSVQQSALILIHELAHAASWSDFEGYGPEDPEREQVAEENEQRTREITGICSRAARFAT